MKKLIALVASLAVFAVVAVFTVSAEVVYSSSLPVASGFTGFEDANSNFYTPTITRISSTNINTIPAVQWVYGSGTVNNFKYFVNGLDLNSLTLPQDATSFRLSLYLRFERPSSFNGDLSLSFSSSSKLKDFARFNITRTVNSTHSLLTYLVIIDFSAVPVGDFGTLGIEFLSGSVFGTGYFGFAWSDATVTGYDSSDQIINGIVGGDGTPLSPDRGSELDQSSDEMTDLENGALGGKSDEQIQQEVDNALSFDVDSLDSNATGSLATYFDGLLVVFGADYQSLLMLALSLGLAAFIIGRRYKTG